MLELILVLVFADRMVQSRSQPAAFAKGASNIVISKR
jgi:hypothetical protein